MKKFTKSAGQAIPAKAYVLEAENLEKLMAHLRESGYMVLGPTVRDEGIVYEELKSAGQLPVGYAETQGPGSYRLKKSNKKTFFGFTVGQESWKKFLYPSVRNFLTASKNGNRFDAGYEEANSGKMAFFGVRACELAALKILDKIFLEGPYIDSGYEAARKNLFIVAINCSQPSDNCFCTSMGTGPKATEDYDLALTEVLNGKEHYFVVESGSNAGEKAIAGLNLSEAAPENIEKRDEVIAKAISGISKKLSTGELSEKLDAAFDDRHWDKIAERCLTCGNCTMVCPTCFCTNVEDTTDLTGDNAFRTRSWDSCHTVAFSYIHGGSIRTSEMARYRQWMMHKLTHWKKQFGTFGCVGCGRCITWCPVGIDITEEAKILINK